MRTSDTHVYVRSTGLLTYGICLNSCQVRTPDSTEVFMFNFR